MATIETEQFLGNIGGAVGGGLKQTSPAVLAAAIINIFLSVLGVIFLVLLVYGGYRWMMARGDTDEVKKATGIIKDAVIGLVIIMLAYSIARFVVSRIVGVTT